MLVNPTFRVERSNGTTKEWNGCGIHSILTNNNVIPLTFVFLFKSPSVSSKVQQKPGQEIPICGFLNLWSLVNQSLSALINERTRRTHISYRKANRPLTLHHQRWRHGKSAANNLNQAMKTYMGGRSGFRPIPTAKLHLVYQCAKQHQLACSVRNVSSRTKQISLQKSDKCVVTLQ